MRRVASSAPCDETSSSLSSFAVPLVHPGGPHFFCARRRRAFATDPPVAFQNLYGYQKSTKMATKALGDKGLKFSSFCMATRCLPGSLFREKSGPFLFISSNSATILPMLESLYLDFCCKNAPISRKKATKWPKKF